MRLVSLALALVLVFTMPAAGEEEKPSDPSCSQEGSLEACLIVTDEGNDLLTKWAQGEPRLTIKNIETAKRGEFITVIVRFLGCQVDENGLCDAVVDYVAYRPDGTVYGEMRDRELWIGKPAPLPGASQLSAEYMGLIIEPTDPAGEYTAEAKVKDRIGDRSVKVLRQFRVPSPPTAESATPLNKSLAEEKAGPMNEAIISVDFETMFPHQYWISSWSRDEAYPQGFRYKVLSVRNEAEGYLELVVVLEESGGLKTEMKRLVVNPDRFDGVAQTFVTGLSEEYNIEFELLDLTDTRDAESFEEKVTAAGWYEWTPQA